MFDLIQKIYNNFGKLYQTRFINRIFSLLIRFPTLRAKVGTFLSKFLPKPKQELLEVPETSSVLAQLETVGVSYLSPLEETKTADILEYLADKPLRKRFDYTSGYRFLKGDQPSSIKMAEYPEETLLSCPHILELANDPFILSLACQRLGCKPTISSISAWWSFAGESHSVDTERFHRDYDDWKFMKYFIYLTAVEDDCGPHILIKNSHQGTSHLLKYRYTDSEVYGSFEPSSIERVTGTIGTRFIADTYGLHKGERPQKGDRLVFQVIYSMFPTPNGPEKSVSKYDGNSSIDPYTNRIYLDFKQP